MVTAGTDPGKAEEQPGASTGSRRERDQAGRFTAGQSAQGNAASDRRNEDPGIGLANRPSGAVKHSPFLQFHLLKALYFRLIKPGRRF